MEIRDWLTYGLFVALVLAFCNLIAIFIIDDRSMSCMAEKGIELCKSKGLEVSRTFNKEVTCVDGENNPIEFRFAKKIEDECFKEAQLFGVR